MNHVAIDLAECSFEDDNVPTSLGQHLLKVMDSILASVCLHRLFFFQLKFFQERIEFFQNNKASSSKRSKSECRLML